MKKIIIAVIVLAIILAGAYFFSHRSPSTGTPPPDQGTTPPAGGSPPQGQVDTTKTVIGASVEKRDITAYHYGTGAKEILFAGGIHGGYSWNTALLAYELMDYLAANPSAVPANTKVTVIPVLNPDGLNKVVGTAGPFVPADVSKSNDTVVSGRFNTNGVDLNRNFACDWQSKGTWQNKTVSGGSAAFSEPESLAFKNYVEAHIPAAVVVWHSAAGGVFASNCQNGISPETRTIANAYAAASGYKAYESFDFYEVTGDMTNWLAEKNIPAISVLLSTHEDTEWNQNKAGIEAVLNRYAK